MARVLAVSDLQAPFQHPRALTFLEKVYELYACDTVIIIGDECDFKFLKYANTHDEMTGDQQHTAALVFLKELYKLFPKAKVMHSNHVKDRINYASQQGQIPKFMIRSIRDIMEAPQTWEWMDSIIIDGVKYEHGHAIAGGKNCVEKSVDKNHRSTVFGHHAHFNLKYFKNGKRQLFGMCIGALTVDANDQRMGWGMAYSKRYTTDIPLGCGVILDGKWPHLLSLYEE